MAEKIINIPPWIVNSGDDTYYYNLVVDTSIGSMYRIDNSIHVSDIKITSIKTAIGKNINNIYSLLRDDSLNTNSYYVSNKTSPYSILKMVGYNKHAKPPIYFAEKPSDMGVNITADGANHKITIPSQTMALRRGEKPPQDNINRWNNIKIRGDIYPMMNEGYYSDTSIWTTIISDINVTSMRNNTQIPSMDFRVQNESSIYRVQLDGYTTVGGDSIFESIGFDISTWKFLPYQLQSISSGLNWLPPNQGATSWNCNISNITPITPNSQTYNGYFYMRFNYRTPEDTPNFRTSVSPLTTINPSSNTLVTFTFEQGAVAQFDSTYPYTIYLYEGTTGTVQTDPCINSRTW